MYNLENKTNNTTKSINKKYLLIIIFILMIFIASFLLIEGINGANDTTNSNLYNNIKPNNISQNDVIAGSKSLYNIIKYDKKLPKTISISDNSYTISEFLYLMSKTYSNKYNKIYTNTTIIYGVKNPNKPSGGNVKGKISKFKWYTYSKTISYSIEKKKRSPNYLKTDTGKKIQFQSLVFLYSKLLSKSKSKIPKSIAIDVKKIDPINHNGIAVALFSKYKKGTSKNYLSSSGHAQANSKYIKNLAKKITKGCKTKTQKAQAITKWVQENIEYSYYYNTKYGAKKTIKLKKGNCVDQAHTVVALLRSLKIPTRYVHGFCQFSDGDKTGHVWTQIYIGGKWKPMDTINSRNSIGRVVNWDTTNYHLYRKVASLSF